MASGADFHSEATDEAKAEAPRPYGARSLTYSGLLLIYAAVAAFAAVAYYSWLMRDYKRPDLYQYMPELLGCAVGIFAALLGVKLIRAGGTSPSDPLPVVNPKEWEILSAAIHSKNNDPIGEYIRLSSLTGATGFFRKLDLSGLPLATIGLTLFFAIGSLFPAGREFNELTQLALGAFIGSFVQKQVASVRDAGDPASETVTTTTSTTTGGAGGNPRPADPAGTGGTGSGEAPGGREVRT